MPYVENCSKLAFRPIKIFFKVFSFGLRWRGKKCKTRQKKAKRHGKCNTLGLQSLGFQKSMF